MEKPFIINYSALLCYFLFKKFSVCVYNIYRKLQKFQGKSYNSLNAGVECSSIINYILGNFFCAEITFPGPSPDPGMGGGGGRKEFHGATFDLILFGLFPEDLEELLLSSVEIWLSFSFFKKKKYMHFCYIDVFKKECNDSVDQTDN